MEFEIIQKKTTPSIIGKQIINAIEEGRLKPGQKLPPERELGKMFGVGRSSVREAIKALVVTGYLVSIQGKGTFVSKIIPKKDDDLNLDELLKASPIFDIMEARHILELHAVKLAAERADMNNIKKMEKAITRMAESGDDIKAFYEADLEFHTAVAEASANVFISHLINILFKKSGRYHTSFMTTSYETKEQTIIMAKKIVDLISQEAGEEAAFWMNKHLSEVDTSLKGVVLEKKGKRS